MTYPTRTAAPEADFHAAPEKQDPRPRHPAVTVAAIGGAAAAAAAGAFFGARALARRNGGAEGRPLNAVMETAVTACEVNGGHPHRAEVQPSAHPRLPA